MLVYGDAVQREPATTALARLRLAMRQVDTTAPGLERHGRLTGLLIDAGMLAQGFADAHFERSGVDAAGVEEVTAMRLVMALAHCCAVSWNCSFAQTATLPWLELRACDHAARDQWLEMRTPEGYAFYALYPESYLQAALRCRASVSDPAAPWRVIGLRSIGTSLSAMVAIALGAPLPLTLRPTGPPFERRIEAEAPARLPGGCRFAIVDEGPGLSGSSMAAAIRWLTGAGPRVRPDQLHLFPSHGNGPGAHASDEVRRLWAQAPQWVSGFDASVLEAGDPAHRLSNWIAQALGPLDEPLQDIGNGAWRKLQPTAASRPPSHPWQERRKYLAHASGRRWLAKFVGLGRRGVHAFERASALAAAGFCPEPVAFCHGFLVERWRDDMRPLPPQLAPPLRSRFVAHLSAYLAYRALRFPAPSGRGASLVQLQAMARHNTQEALGATAATAWQARESLAASLQARVMPIETDSRLHAWEWLMQEDRFLKTDAVDHHAAHDLVGCQDVAWDIAGATVELSLSDKEELTLIGQLRAAGVRLDEDLLRFLKPCYLAFQMGYFRMALDDSREADDRPPLEAARARYEAGLTRWIAKGAL